MSAFAARSGGVFRSREGGCGGRRCGSPLAREIPDIFIPLTRNENSGMTMLFFSLRVAPVSGGDHGVACERIPPGFRWEGKPAWRRRFRNDDGLGVVAVCSEGGCRREGLTTGVVRHACRHRVTARGVFVLGDSFTRPELGNDIGLMGALLPFVLRLVAGACVGRWTGQARMPPRERQHEGLGGLGDSFAVGLGAVAGAWVDHRSGQTRMPPQSDGTRVKALWFFGVGILSHARERRHEGVFCLGGLFCGFVGGVVAVCFEGCCGSMCWPVDRPGTHAAAGAAARGALIFCFGDCFTCSELGNDTMTMGGCCRLD